MIQAFVIISICTVKHQLIVPSIINGFENWMRNFEWKFEKLHETTVLP
jgi:hypothetical protein